MILEWLNQINIVIVQTDSEREAVRHIRKSVYCNELGWLKPERVWDSYDHFAVILLVGSNDRWGGTARILDPNRPFEMEEHFDLARYRSAGVCAEVGRLAVLPEYRGSLLALALFHALFRFAISRKIQYYCAAAHPQNRLYTSLGFRVVGDEIIYPPVDAPAIPYVLDLEDAQAEWRRKRPRLLSHFMQPIAGIG